MLRERQYMTVRKAACLGCKAAAGGDAGNMVNTQIVYYTTRMVTFASLIVDGLTRSPPA